MNTRGTVYLVGAGPGAPDLLTLRAADLLRRADIVFYDALVHPEIVALAAGADKIAVGKRCGRHSTAQRFINKRLVDAALKHEVVVRLKGGDPTVFGRLQEELDALQAAGIPTQIVPGITAATAAAAELGVSLTQRGVSRSVAITTPRVGADETASDWTAGLVATDTVVVYMGVGKAAEVVQGLVQRGFDPFVPVAVVENASLPERKVTWCALASLVDAVAIAVGGPALIIVGRTLAAAHRGSEDRVLDTSGEGALIRSKDRIAAR